MLYKNYYHDTLWCILCLHGAFCFHFMMYWPNSFLLSAYTQHYVVYLNRLQVALLWVNMQLYNHFLSFLPKKAVKLNHSLLLSFLNTELVQVVENLCRGWQGETFHTYSDLFYWSSSFVIFLMSFEFWHQNVCFQQCNCVRNSKRMLTTPTVIWVIDRVENWKHAFIVAFVWFVI